MKYCAHNQNLFIQDSGHQMLSKTYFIVQDGTLHLLSVPNSTQDMAMARLYNKSTAILQLIEDAW